jgi:hypothetical protein
VPLRFDTGGGDTGGGRRRVVGVAMTANEGPASGKMIEEKATTTMVVQMMTAVTTV